MEQKYKKNSGTGLRPVTSFQISRRNLPHWQLPGSIYFITWRCLEEKILSGKEKTIILDSILYWNNIKWIIHAAVVMTNHVHILVEPLPIPEGGYFNLSEIIRSVKTFSARTINKLRDNQGFSGRMKS
jgi:REP element-mobilizing transposase RayT